MWFSDVKVSWLILSFQIVIIEHIFEHLGSLLINLLKTQKKTLIKTISLYTGGTKCQFPKTLYRLEDWA